MGSVPSIYVWTRICKDGSSVVDLFCIRDECARNQKVCADGRFPQALQKTQKKEVFLKADLERRFQAISSDFKPILHRVGVRFHSRRPSFLTFEIAADFLELLAMEPTFF